MSRSMNFDVTSSSASAERDFRAMADAAERLEDKLRRLDQLTVTPSAQLNITPATRSIQQLQTRLDALRNVRATVQIDGAAEARRDVAALVVEIRKLRNARVRVDIDGNARTSLTALTAQLRALRDVKVKVSLDDGTFARDIARLHQRVSALRGTTVRINFDIQPPGVRAELEAISQALRNIRDVRARVQVDTEGATAAVARLGSALGKIGKGGAIALSIPGIISLIGQVGSLGASVLDLTGVLGLLPAAGVAGGAALATLGLGLAHVADALGPTGTPAQLKKVNEALAALSPAAREAVDTIRGLGPAFSGMRLEVQERLFAGVGAEVQQLATAYLPTLKAGLGGIATELNTGAKMWSDWASAGPAVTDLNTILDNTRSTLRELAPAGTDVAAALTDIAVVGSEIMPELAAGATEATARFREFIAEARRTGELEQWIRGGISTLEQLGRIALNTGGILGSVFQASETAGYGFLAAVEQITGELDNLLSSAAGQNALVEVFRESRDAINSALPGIRELAGATLEMFANFARSDGLQRFAELVSQTASAIAPLVSQIGSLAGDALGNLASGASLAVSALAPLVGGVSAVVDGLGPLPGLALAAVVAFKGLGLATASIVALGTAIAGTAALTGTLAAGLTGSLAAGAAAQAGMTRLGGAVSALGRALPLIGVAAIGVAFAMDGLTTSTSEAADVMSRGGQAAAELRASLLAQQEAMQRNVAEAEASATGYDDLSRSIKYWVQENIFGIATLDSVNAALDEQRANMTDLERAQDDVARATRDYQLAVDQFTANSPQARAAAAGLADAHERLGEAEGRAAELGRSHTEQIQAQNDAMRSQISTAFAYEDAVRATAEAHQAAADVLASSGADSDEYRARVTDLARAIDDQAAAASAQATALGGAEAGAAAYATEILRATDVSTGPGRDAFVRLAGAMDTAGLAALTSAAEVSGLATEIITLPDGRTVTIVAAADRAQLDSVTDDLNALAATEFVGTVTINGDAAPFRDGLLQSVTLANGTAAAITLNANGAPAAAVIGNTKYTVDTTTGVMTIDGNPAPGEADLSGFKLHVDSETGVMTVEANTDPAMASTTAAVTFADGSIATITIDGDPTTANGKTTTAVRFADGSTGTITVDANAVPANGQITGVVRYGNGSVATVTVNARDLATPVLNSLNGRSTSSTHTVYLRSVGRLPGTLTGLHDGGVVAASSTRYHDGGVATRFASGGTARPFRAGIAQLFPPRHLRITGDRVDVDEFYLPDNSARRSMALGSEWARRRGMALVPRNTANAATSLQDSPSAGSAAPSSGSTAIDLRAAMATPRGTQISTAPIAAAVLAANGQLRGELAQLRAQFSQLASAVRDARPITVNEARNGVESAQAVRLSLRL